MACAHGVVQVDLNINHTAYEAMDIGEHQIFLGLERSLVFCVLLVRREFHTSELRLNEEASFVSMHGDIHLDWEFDAIAIVDTFEKLLLGSPKAYFVVLFGLYKGRQL